MPLQAVPHIFATVQRARHGAARGLRRAGPGGHAARLEHR